MNERIPRLVVLRLLTVHAYRARLPLLHPLPSFPNARMLVQFWLFTVHRSRSVTSVFPPPTLPTNHDLLLRRVTVRSYTLRLSLRASIIVSSFRVRRVSVVFLIKMAQNIEHVVATCQERLLAMPRTTYGRVALGDVGIQFLKDVGLIRSAMARPTCGLQMTWCADASKKDDYRWRCRRKTPASRCCASISIRHGSWFTRSDLNFMEVSSLTTSCAVFLPSVSSKRIISEHIPSLTGPSSAGRLCWITWRATLKR
jgi:hypothetical protein